MGRHQIQQWAGPKENHAPPDRNRLRLQSDLRCAETVGAGELPSFHRHQSIRRTRRNDQRIVRQRIRRAVVHDMEVAIRDVPGEVAGAIIDLRLETVERRVERLRASDLGAIKRGFCPHKAVGLTPVDLAAVAGALVDHNGANPCCDHRLGRPHTRRSSTDDDYPRFSHVASRCCVTIDRPARTGVSQARSRSPVSVQTQQS